MAEGYDNRQGGRASFAFTPAAPVQARTTATGQSRGAQVQGGNSRGGVERATAITAPTDGDLPEFLNKMMEPYVLRRQQEAFTKGRTAAQSGASLDEIHKSESGFLSTLVGPSPFEQGAAAYTAMGKLNEWQEAAIKDQDTLKRLPPEELGKVLTERERAMMTGNPVADSIISQGMAEQSGPLVSTITKARYAWQQETRLAAQSGAWDQAASAWQAVATANAGLTGPSDPEPQAVTMQRGSFLSTFQKPADMTDAAYQSALFNSARNMQVNGNFYAFEAMKVAGLMKAGGPMTDEQLARLETGYDANAHRVLGEAAHDPEVVAAWLALDVDSKLGRVESPLEAAARVEDINAIVARKTGITGLRLYDASAVRAAGSAQIDAAIGAARRVQERQWQIADREDAQQFQLDKEAAERAQKAAAAQSFAAAGRAKTADATGIASGEDLNTIFGNAVTGGNVALIAQNFDREGYLNSYAAGLMQSGVRASIGKGYTDGFERSYQQWQALHKVSPAAAASYMGEYAAQMEAFDNARKGGDTGLSAYAQTFDNPTAGKGSTLPVGVTRKEAYADVLDAVRSGEASFMWGDTPLGGRVRLNDASAQRIAGHIYNEAVSYAQIAGIPFKAAAARLRQREFANGKVERAGPLAWVNAHSMTPLARILKQPDERVDEAFRAVVDGKLKAAGYVPGIGGADISVMRIEDREGVAALYVKAFPDDGGGLKDVWISSTELKAWLDGKALADVAGNQPGPARKPNRLMQKVAADNAQGVADFNKGRTGTVQAPDFAPAPDDSAVYSGARRVLNRRIHRPGK